MPTHDWTRVAVDTFLDFRLGWLSQLQSTLNTEVLPADHYAQVERVDANHTPDVLRFAIDHERMIAVVTPDGADARPDVVDDYKLLVVRQAETDRAVAVVSIVFPTEGRRRYWDGAFSQFAVEALHRGYHLLVIGLFPPLTLAAYSAGPRKRAYVEPTAVGRELIDMPLFLTDERYINVPLEETYRAAYRGVARKWKAVLEAAPPG